MLPYAILSGFKVTTVMMLAYKQWREGSRDTDREREKGCIFMISEGRGLTVMEKDEGGQTGQMDL